MRAGEVLIQDGCAATVGCEQCLDPGTEFGVTAALALQVGGTLRRVGEVRRGQEQGFRSRGIDGHGSPPGSGVILLPQRRGTLSMPHPGEKCLTEFELFFQGLAEPGPRILPVPVGHRPGEPQRLARLFDRKSSEQVELRDLCGGGVFLTEPRQQFVQRQDEVGILGERNRPDRAARAVSARPPASAASDPEHG